MDTSDQLWCWYYLADCGSWHSFEDDPDSSLKSEDLEKYYLRNSKAILIITSFNGQNEFDFSAMLQTDLNTGRQRMIHRGCNMKRSCSCFSTAQALWENVDPSPYQLIRLNELTPEYQTVAGYVKKDGLLDRPLVSIYRIQNLDLWEMYCRKKKQLKRIHGVKEIKERRLFHGTEIKNVDTICKYNFDLRLANQEQHIYGKGIYFAKHATLADTYSRRSTDPLPLCGDLTQHGEETKIMFLARVMIGTPIVGKTHFLKPDHGSLENTHNSCVDDINHPKIVVIFDPNQIYPEYLIQYK
uniref:Poly [ADP-ribose] polymerase n=1 Tax=Labrus bergylta TaxID=56723 RepID=A0A3Q3FXY7_9LABR|nr:protein mono-ADP-ribosyltransferase PARP11-like isoform X1 [Labrus bergylta]